MSDISRSKAAELLKKPYARVVVPETDGSFRAEIAEFPGCIALADTAAEALADLEDIALSWLESTLERGQPIPAPMGNAEYSGKLVLRLPRSLHRKVAQLADRDGVSINQFLVSATAEQVGAKSTQMVKQSAHVVVSLTASIGPSHALASTYQPYVGESIIAEEVRYAEH